VLGCPVVELIYLYDVNDKALAGMESVPFLLEGSAEDYVERNPRDSSLTIRMKPGQPEVSIMANDY
jgi:hypothetical protein